MRFTDPKSRRWTENARKQQVQAYWQINNTTTHFFHFTLQMMNIIEYMMWEESRGRCRRKRMVFSTYQITSVSITNICFWV